VGGERVQSGSAEDPEQDPIGDVDTEFAEVSYSDDVVFTFIEESNERLVKNTSRGMAIIDNTFFLAGLDDQLRDWENRCCLFATGSEQNQNTKVNRKTKHNPHPGRQRYAAIGV
jgi:hypothetical protein